MPRNKSRYFAFARHFLYPYVLAMHFDLLNKSFLTSLPKLKKIHGYLVILP